MWRHAMPGLKLPITFEQFLQLPRNPAYKYEYFNDHAYLSARPKTYHAVLDMRPYNAAPNDGADSSARLRPVVDADWNWMPGLFADAFHNLLPFGGLDDGPREAAARACLDRTRSGGDGPWIKQASFVAGAAGQDHPVGAILVTLIPNADLAGGDDCTWQEPPPADCLKRRLGRPHLTWIFVSPLAEGQGVGTALLGAAVLELLALGFVELASTFLLGNHSSMLWHWRNGFRLLPYPGSQREMKKLTGMGREQ
jgi:GNAT superfamily N-acetyltransferase